MFRCENCVLNAILVSYDKSSICDPVLLMLLNLLGEIDKMLGKASHLIFPPTPTRLI